MQQRRDVQDLRVEFGAVVLGERHRPGIAADRVIDEKRRRSGLDEVSGFRRGCGRGDGYAERGQRDADGRPAVHSTRRPVPTMSGTTPASVSRIASAPP